MPPTYAEATKYEVVNTTQTSETNSRICYVHARPIPLVQITYCYSVVVIHNTVYTLLCYYCDTQNSLLIVTLLL